MDVKSSCTIKMPLIIASLPTIAPVILVRGKKFLSERTICLIKRYRYTGQQVIITFACLRENKRKKIA